MHPRRLRAVVTALLTGSVLLLAGCVRADADLTLDGRSNTVSGTIAITAPLSEASDAAREAAASVALAVENRVLPGIRDVQGVTAAPLEADGGYGTELTLDRVDIDDLFLGDPAAADGRAATPLITREADEFVVRGTIDATTQPDVPTAAAEGERPPGAAESRIALAITFPGPVQDVLGSEDVATVDGTTVTWTTSWDSPLQLDATAAATSAAFPPWIWKALLWGLGGLAVLALLGLVTVWLRSRSD